MFDNKRIKNIKIANWRLMLVSLNFQVEYRPGRFNVAADAHK